MALIDGGHCFLDIPLANWEFASMTIRKVKAMAFLASTVHLQVFSFMVSELGRTGRGGAGRDGGDSHALVWAGVWRTSCAVSKTDGRA